MPAATARAQAGPPAVRLSEVSAQILGKRLYRTADGKLIELPSDISYEQAAKLEAEAKAAEKQIGKGPPPQPVPDVKKLAKKEDKKAKAKPGTKGGKDSKRGGKAAPKAGAAASAMLKAVGTSKVAQYLTAKATPVLQKGFGKLQQLRQNEQTHDDAAAKRSQAEQAVVIPPSEGQAKSNTGQVNTVSGRPAPTPDENKGKQILQESLKANVPQSIEDVDNFKRDKKAQHMGADVMSVVLQDKNAVVSTYEDMGHTPAPAPREHEPEDLPPQEAAPATGGMNLGKDTIAPLQKDHTDLSNYTKEGDAKLKEEGVTQEQLDMVDSGDLATANKEKKGMEIAAKTEPLAVQKFAEQQSASVDKDLKQEETKQRSEMKTKRKAGLGATAQKQKGAKSALEKKREEVAGKINGIYTTAQDKVKKRLADLETESMKRFDDGNAKATKEFEDNVNRELDAFKADRYSGWFGWARKAKDWLLGMDDLPEVKAIFDRNRAMFVTTIDKLVANIAADNKRVIQECKDELQNARNQIKEFVDKLGPSLKDIGKKAAGEMNAKLEQMDKFIAQKEEDLQNKLKDKQTAAIKAIDEKIEKMKDAMSGALAKLGKLLLLAAKKFFTWALQKFGYSLEEIEGFINRGVAVLKAIFTQPIKFVKNLMRAAITGFENFGKNFLKHLKDALFEWLTGSLEGLVLPTTWDFPGIIGVALQMIGISYANIRKHMVTVMGEPVVSALEKSFTLVKTLITQGPMAAWDQLKEMAGEMRDAFIEAVKDFIKQKIIEQAIQWLVSLFIPGAGIVKAIIGIYDTVVFFVKKAKQIMQMISNFLGSIGEIAAGNIGAAADAMEKGLARGLSLVINFLAQLLHLSGITNKIRDAIQKIKDKVDAVLLKVAKWIGDKASKLWGSIKTTAGKIAGWWKARKSFRVGKETHSLTFKGESEAAQLVVESSPVLLDTYLKNLQPKPDQKAVDKVNKQIKIIDDIKVRTKGGFGQEDGKKIQAAFEEIVNVLKTLSGEPPATKPDWSKKKKLGSGTVTETLKADPLSLNPGGLAGSRPYDESVLWKKVNQRPMTYVRGHLLNHHLHGPGKDENLIPITISANTTMGKSSGPEGLVKKAILDENKVVRYTVKAVFGGHPIRKVIPEEAELPTGIKIEAVELTKGTSGNWDKVVSSIYNNTIPNTLPADLPVGVLREEVNLSNPDVQHLNKNPHIKAVPGLAVRIKNERVRRDADYHSWDQLPLRPGEAQVLETLKADSKWLKLHG